MSDNQKIFDEELLPHLDALYDFAYHFAYDENDANDLVQETYLKAWKSIDSYKIGTNAKAWLFTILRNTFINNYRSKKNRPNQVDFEDITNYHEEEDDTNFSSFFDLREDLFQDMMGDEVTIALNSLDPKFRAVIILCDLQGFKYEEIAKILELPIGTVRSRLHRGRNELKKTLKVYAEENFGYK